MRLVLAFLCIVGFALAGCGQSRAGEVFAAISIETFDFDELPDDAPQSLVANTAERPRVVKFRLEHWKPGKHKADVGPVTAWAASNGDWHYEGWVDHQSFWGTTYRLGVQFGDGRIWYTDSLWGPRVSHSNGSRKHHQGGGTKNRNIRINFGSIRSCRFWFGN